MGLRYGMCVVAGVIGGRHIDNDFGRRRSSTLSRVRPPFPTMPAAQGLLLSSADASSAKEGIAVSVSSSSSSCTSSFGDYSTCAALSSSAGPSTPRAIPESITITSARTTSTFSASRGVWNTGSGSSSRAGVIVRLWLGRNVAEDLTDSGAEGAAAAFALSARTP